MEINKAIDIILDLATKKWQEGAASSLDIISSTIRDYNSSIVVLFTFLEENKEELRFKSYSILLITLN